MKKEVQLDKGRRLINAGCVLLVTAAYRDRSNVMALAWQTPLSDRPPLVGIAVALSHFTCEVLAASAEEEHFTVDCWNEKTILPHHLGGKEFYLTGERKKV